MNLKVFRLRHNAKLPKRAHDGDAGMDFYFCRKESGVGKKPVYPGETALFPTGIKVEIPKGYMLEIKNKSSVAAKKQLLVGACVIDSGYDGEVFINLNTAHCNANNIQIATGEDAQVAQAFSLKVVKTAKEREAELKLPE